MTTLIYILNFDVKNMDLHTNISKALWYNILCFKFKCACKPPGKEKKSFFVFVTICFVMYLRHATPEKVVLQEILSNLNQRYGEKKISFVTNKHCN